MKNFMNKYKSWFQKNPNIIGEAVDAMTIKDVEKKIIKKQGRKGGIDCPHCPK